MKNYESTLSKSLAGTMLEQSAIENLEIEELSQYIIINPISPTSNVLGISRKFCFIKFTLYGSDESQSEAEK